MLEAVEVGSKVGKKEYEEQVPQLRVDLVNAQYDLQCSDFSVLVLIVGDDRLGCNDVIDILHEWMDARYLDTYVFLQPSDEELERPRFWRYWRAMPPKGKIGLFLGAWGLNAVAERLRDQLGKKDFATRISHIRTLEQELAADGVLLLKFWLHIPKKELKERLQKAKKDPDKLLGLEETDWDIYEAYDDVIPIAEHFLRETGELTIPWHIIESTDTRYRNLTVARTLLGEINTRLASDTDKAPGEREKPLEVSMDDALGSVDLTATLDKDEYKKRLKSLQLSLHKLTLKAREKKMSSVLVFEGWDAAGKGGVIRRITGPMAARDYRVIPIAAPTDEEKARHYLWRFWRQLPRAGHMTVFDRSWYGRVLVERVEGFASENEWRRAYGEINDFESQLVESGIPVFKFWLHIDPEEQLRRFQAREKTAYKKYKITDEDYRNREKWDDYVTAVNEMVGRTSTEMAPWTLVAANDKKAARIQVLETVVEGLKKALRKR